jgi:hypothetical protein
LVFALTSITLACDTRHEAARKFSSSVKGDESVLRAASGVVIMDAKVMDLVPGDKVSLDFEGTQYGIFVGKISPHPLHPHLWLVVWRVYPDRGAPFWSHDALSPFQMVGYYVQPRTRECLDARLQAVLHQDRNAAALMMNLEAYAKKGQGV